MEPRIRSMIIIRESQSDLNVPPKRTNNKLHWIALVTLAVCPIGSYMSYDAPGALSNYYINDFGLTLTQLGGLYTAYAVPCLALAPFCGTLSYHFGAHRFLIAGNVFVILGTLGFTFANELWAMIMMRVLFGIGIQIVMVAGSLLIEEWFRNSRYLGVALSTVISFPLLGTFLAFAVLPQIALAKHVQAALLVTLGVCIVSGIASIVYYKLLHPLLKKELKAELKESQGEDANEKPQPKENILKIHLSAIRNAKREFWLICGFCFALDATGFPFLAMAGQFFYDKYGFSETYSTSLVCLFCLIAIVCGPVLNFAVDRIGRRVTISLFVSLTQFAVFLVFGLTYLHPAFGIVLAALAYIIGCGTVYNLASRTATKDHEIGTLFSILSVFPNFTFLVMPLVFGALRDQTGDYLWSCIFFAIVDMGGCVCMLILKRMDTCDLDSKSGTDAANLQLELKVREDIAI